MLEIIGNGSKWAGDVPDSVDTLLQVLSEHPLDHRLAPFIRPYDSLTPLPNRVLEKKPAGTMQFFGDFVTVSHCFRIYTDEPLLIEALTDAITKNMASAEYIRYSDTPSVWDEAFKFGRVR